MEQRPMCWGIKIGIDIDGYRLAVYKGHLFGISKMSIRYIFLHFYQKTEILFYFLFFKKINCAE